MATATAQKTEQIVNLDLRVRFTFTDSYDGDTNTEYVKVMPTHYRKADAEGAVCLPITRLCRGIRTIVRVS